MDEAGLSEALATAMEDLGTIAAETTDSEIEAAAHYAAGAGSASQPFYEIVRDELLGRRDKARESGTGGGALRQPGRRSVDDAVLERVERLRVDDAAREILRSEREARAATEAFTGVEPIQRLRDFLEEDDAPVAYLVDRLAVTGGRTLLAAEAKAGKTSLAIELIRALSSRTPFLGRFPCAWSADMIVYVNLEMTRTLLRAWFRAAGANLDQVAIWDLRGCGHLLDVRQPAVRRQLSGRLTAAGVWLLVIDPAGAVWDALGIDENNNTEVGAWLAGLDALLAETATLTDVVVLHHFGHGAERARGASKLLGWPDQIWEYRLERSSNENEDAAHRLRFLSVRGRDAELPESRVDFDPATKRLTMTADATSLRRERQQAKCERTLRQILDYVAEAVPEERSKSAVEEAMGGHRGMVRSAYLLGERRGWIDIDESGRAHILTLTAKGAEEASRPTSPNLARNGSGDASTHLAHSPRPMGEGEGEQVSAADKEPISPTLPLGEIPAESPPSVADEYLLERLEGEVVAVLDHRRPTLPPPTMPPKPGRRP